MNVSTWSRVLGSTLLSTVLLAGCKEHRATAELVRVVPTVRVVGRSATPATPPAEREAVPAPTLASTSRTVLASTERRAPRDDEARRPARTSDGSGPKVKKLVIARQVDRKARKPEGVGGSFVLGEFEKLFAFLEVDSRDAESEIFVSFDPPGEASAKGRVPLKVGESPRFRTWASSRAIDKRGVWTAIVTTADGRELARESFLVM